MIEQDTRFYGIDLLRGDESNADLEERLGTVEREFFVVALDGDPRSVFDGYTPDPFWPSPDKPCDWDH